MEGSDGSREASEEGAKNPRGRRMLPRGAVKPDVEMSLELVWAQGP